jgi:RNA polymerase sigma-70 factor (ECF subfamily)
VEALNETPSPFREVLRMFYWDELPVEEIARILAISSGTVKSRLARGRSMIRERIMAAARSREDIVRKLMDWMSPGDS